MIPTDPEGNDQVLGELLALKDLDRLEEIYPRTCQCGKEYLVSTFEQATLPPDSQLAMCPPCKEAFWHAGRKLHQARQRREHQPDANDEPRSSDGDGQTH